MSSNSQPAKPSSRWGVTALLQQAVAGVESRLDTILAEEEDAAPRSTKDKHSEQPGLQSGMSFPKPISAAPSRSSSTARTNDRLKERLARAMVKPGGAGNLGSPSSTAVPSGTSSPLPLAGGRVSLDSSSEIMDGSQEVMMRDDSASISSAPRSSEEVGPPSRSSREIHLNSGSVSGFHDHRAVESLQKECKQADIGNIDSEITILGSHIPAIGVPGLPTEPIPTQIDYEAAMAQLQADHDASELRWQEELHEYTERIDALQSKLKYLAKEAAESARKTAGSVESDSVERKLLEKDEQIAALMEEGQKLSKTELEHRGTIKKLRQYAAENTKLQAETKRKVEKIENDLLKTEARAKRAEAAERKAIDRLNSQSKLEKDLEVVTAERDALGSAVADIKTQLARAVARAEAAEQRAQMETAEIERRLAAELRDDLSSAKIEREISEEKLRREIRDLKEELKRERERAQMLEIELRGEQTVLESKMETLRARAEEVSSSATGDAHAVLLRQIETLQTQYAVASENWHGIEGSLLSRLAHVEKERDEIARKEGELRRKVREAHLKAKRVEGELENSREVRKEMEDSLEESKQETEKTLHKLRNVEKDLLVARQDLAKQQEVSDIMWSQRLEDERAKWQEHAISSPSVVQQPRIESPITFGRKSAGLDMSRTMSDRPTSRQHSVLQIPFSEMEMPARQNSSSSMNSNPHPRQPCIETSIPSAEDPSGHPFEPDEYFNGLVTPSTQGTYPQHSRGINDIISVSTAAAGPSVQLVERMSATVRRLESERAASKDELARLTAQRDEARQEVIELMREVEEKRKADQRIQDLEAIVSQLDQRYQTTLEMLGEKSEQVEELKADIADLKKIYRELVETTMK